MECLSERARDVLSFGDHEVMLSNRHGHTTDVSLLESVSTQQRATDLTGDSDNRNRVHLSIRERGHQVSSTRAGSRDTDTDLAGNLRVTSGSVASSLLVAHENVAELFRVINRIVERKHCTTGNTEGYLDTKLFKGSDNGLCTRNSLGGAGARLSRELGGRWGVLLVRVHDFAPGSWWATTQHTFTQRSYECGVGYNPNVHIVRSQSRQLDTPSVSHPEHPPDSNENPAPTLGITLPRNSPTTTPGTPKPAHPSPTRPSPASPKSKARLYA